MPGLVIKLKPHEKVLLNGVLVQNGPSSAQLRIRTAGAHVLRMRDALRPLDAATPSRQLYYVAQLALLGEIDSLPAQSRLLEGLAALDAFYSEENARDIISRARAAVMSQRFFPAMRALRCLFELDDTHFRPRSLDEPA